MSEDTRQDDRPAEAAPKSDPPLTTPFDRPFFMPVLLALLAVWFGYDGWFNEEIESIMFNRVVFGLLVVLAIYTTRQDLREVRKAKQDDPS